MTLSKLATLNGGAANDAEIGAANAELRFACACKRRQKGDRRADCASSLP